MSEHAPLTVLIVEDEALLAMELQMLIEDCGHAVVGWAATRHEADLLLDTCAAMPDLAFVDVHLADGPTGTIVAAHLLDRGVGVVYMTANAKRIPEDFGGAIGLIAKPYTSSSVSAALDYLHVGVRNPPPLSALPPGLTLSPAFEAEWSVDRHT